MPEVLRFGISSLDQLLGIPSEKSRSEVLPGIYLPQPAPRKRRKKSLGKTSNFKGSFTTSVCIIGPTGTGKSIFALHMASSYVSDCKDEQVQSDPNIELPTILYISTDLTYKMANRAWTNFALDYPLSRCDPFHQRPTVDAETPVQLVKCHPTGLAENFEIIDKDKGNVLFLDMATHTAGDDWGFLHKLLSLLPMPRDEGATPSPRHLVVIDAIEGFEAVAGDVNAFGERSTRRSRIAQVMRLIAGKCHLLLVVEQAKGTATQETLGEEFVADTVIRLESISTRDYERRVLKVEKCRGQSHIRGHHHYSIRSGIGSTTGKQTNPDDPKIPAQNNQVLTNDSSDGYPAVNKGATQSYVQVFHSVHRISRKIMEDETHDSESRTIPPASYYAAFGIQYLDNMLGGKTETTERKEGKEHHFQYDTRGLPCSSTTALIGDSLTQKSTLGRAFLSRCFSSFPIQLRNVWDDLENASSDGKVVNGLVRYITRRVQLLSDVDPSIRNEQRKYFKTLLRKGNLQDLVDELEEIVGENSIVPKGTKRFSRSLKTHLAAWLLGYHGGGVAVMLVTYNADVDLLANEFVRWLHTDEELKRLDSPNCMPGYEAALRNHIKSGTICRRLEIHNLSSEVLVHIVRQAIYAAQRKIMAHHEMDRREQRYQRSWPIRVVIDDFSSLRSIFPELREDPLLFPSLLFHLEREGVTTLIIDTQAGKPEIEIAERFETEFRQMVHHRLYTWRVPFYGQSRVAIAAIPPLSHEYAGIVRELRWETERLDVDYGEPVTVDPHFELYSGLEEGKPQPVQLHVRFYAETPAMEQYVLMENNFLGEMFTAYPHPGNTGPPRIIVGMGPTGYGDLRDLAYLQRDTRLDYTFIFQVDEFWSMRAPGRHKRAGAFQPQSAYLDAITATSTSTDPLNNGSDTDKQLRAEDYRPAPHADPYQLFTLRKQDDSPHLYSGKPSPVLRRRHFFEEYYEDFKRREIFESDDKEQFRIDRVPFSWDFAFLLCQERAWKDNARAFSVENWNGKKRELRVGQVWRSLTKAEYDEPTPPSGRDKGTDKNNKKQIDYVSWRIFTEACKKAAEEQSDKFAKPVTAFDFAQISPESFSSLMLELWLSEIYDTLARDQKAGTRPRAEIEGDRERLLSIGKRQLFIPLGESKIEPDPLTLLELVKRYWLELYKSWLLLIELIDLHEIIGDAPITTFELKSKNTDFCAIASRHWYKTATQCPDEIAVKEPLVAVRLPGHFSVRGDWFLAVSGGSRSIRQAERALDLLNSRRANVTRLQMGVGLPTRLPTLSRTKEGPGHRSLYTKLISHQRGQHNVEYDTLLKIAADSNQEFYWIFRSSLEDYAESNRIWQRWLNYTLLWWHRKLLRYRSAWRNTFAVHDALSRRSYSQKEFADAVGLEKRGAELAEADSQRRQDALDEFAKEHPGVHSAAQLRVRLDYLKLWNLLIEELRRVPVASERISPDVS